jgi:hypothetical protein
MSENEHQVLKRYVLGELSEDERDALEQRYFNDQQFFGLLLKVETELVDDYVRGRLSAADRANFERSYLQNPDRARRVKFAAALATRIDRSNTAITNERASEGFFARWIDRIRTGKIPLVPAFALVSLLLLCGVVWLFIEQRSYRSALQTAEGDRQEEERRLREIEQSLKNEQQRANDLSAELEAARKQQSPGPEPGIATLLLSIAGIRDTGQLPATLTIPAGSNRVRILIDANELDYSDYRAALNAADGREVFSWGHLRPAKRKSLARFSLEVPPAKLDNGDYILTLRGVTPNGEIDDLNKSVFRVKKVEPR